MKEVLILILLLCIVNTVLLLRQTQHYREPYFPTNDRTSTRVGPYDGVSSCSSWGVRNVREHSSFGDDSSLFNGFGNGTVNKAIQQ